jgi:hypothetical protein
VTILLAAASCRKPSSTPSPPDLSHCTRLEIQYSPSVYEAIAPGPADQNILDPQETQYLQSVGTLTVGDQSLIKKFAQNVALSTYTITVPKGASILITPVVHVTGYRGEQKSISFLVRGPSIEDENRNLFSHNGQLDILSLASETRHFRQRVQCATRLRSLRDSMESYQTRGGVSIAPIHWSSEISSAAKPTDFQCPSADNAKCNYAMNPDCQPSSSPDTVLLFETKAGWNQHGGPELFTFDNHDPKGGCVLLNDGTVRFIRTKEELAQLRWKP